MKILTHFLLRNYIKVLCLSVVSFIAILLVSRLQEIAHFAALGAKWSYLFLFTLYQIPYVLPIAIPVSCLISAMILFQRLSHTCELTAFRAGGVSLFQITSPLLTAATFLSLLSFYITSEMATSSHLATRKMVYDLSSVNPLILLQSTKIAKIHGAFVQMKPIHNGKEAKDLLIALNTKRLHLYLAKKVTLEEGSLEAKHASFISTSPSHPFDHLMIENQKVMFTGASEFAKLLKNQGWKIANDHLKLSLLKVRFRHLKEEIKKERNPVKLSKFARALEKCKAEGVRRVSMAIACFTFTLLGIAFGMEISRSRTKRGILAVLILASFALISFFTAKEFDHILPLALALFLVPHLAIVGFSFLSLRCISRGIE